MLDCDKFREQITLARSMAVHEAAVIALGVHLDACALCGLWFATEVDNHDSLRSLKRRMKRFRPDASKSKSVVGRLRGWAARAIGR